MTDIYTDEGTLDYAEAARTLANLKAVGNDQVKTQTVNRITAAAALDIAVSLNAIVTALATGGVWLDEPEREVGPDGEPMGDEEREDAEPVDDTPLEVGDWVARRADIEDGEPTFYLIEAIGTTEGSDYAVLPDLGKVWVSELVRIDPGAVREVSAALEGAPAESSIDDDDAPTGADMVDDIDSDFDAPTTEAVKPAKDKSKGKNKSKGKG